MILVLLVELIGRLTVEIVAHMLAGSNYASIFTLDCLSFKKFTRSKNPQLAVRGVNARFLLHVSLSKKTR